MQDPFKPRNSPTLQLEQLELKKLMQVRQELSHLMHFNPSVNQPS